MEWLEISRLFHHCHPLRQSLSRHDIHRYFMTYLCHRLPITARLFVELIGLPRGCIGFWSTKAEIAVMPVIIRIDRTILVTGIEICFFWLVFSITIQPKQ